MKGKVLFVAGLAVGYVLGTRAGRKRYEQIKGAALKVWETPGIQKQVHKAQDFAAEKIGEIPGAIVDGVAGGVKKLVTPRTPEKDAAKADEPAKGTAPVSSTSAPKSVISD